MFLQREEFQGMVGCNLATLTVLQGAQVYLPVIEKVSEIPNNQKRCFELWKVKNSLTRKKYSGAQDVSRKYLLFTSTEALGNVVDSN